MFSYLPLMRKITALREDPTLDLEQLLASWQITLKAEHKSRHTVRNYGVALRSYLSSGRTTLDKASVQEWLSTIPESGTANTYARNLKRFSSWLAEEGETSTDLLAGLKPPTPKEKMVSKMPEEDIKAMLKASSGRSFRDIRDSALIAFGYSTGIRASEVLNMRLEHIDMTRQLAVVLNGKGGRTRVVPFSDAAARYMDRYMRARRRHPLHDSPWLWLGGELNKLSPHLSYNGLQATLKRRAELAGVTGFHFHRLRHSMASNWLAAGGSEGGLMAVAGWKNRTMIDRYAADTASVRAVDEARKLGLGNLF